MVFIDTEGTFRLEQLEKSAKGLNFNKDQLSIFYYIRICTSLQQNIVLKDVLKNPTSLHKYVRDKTNITMKPLGLIVMDSIISHFCAEDNGRGMLAERQQVLNAILSNCLRFVHANHALVLVTNQVVNIPDAPRFAPTIMAAGGAIVSHATTYRLYIRKGKGERRIIKVIDARNLPQNEVVIALTSQGMEDVAG